MHKINPFRPLFDHDCLGCKYLGSFQNHDLYCCDNGLYRSYIARYGNDYGEYLSCPSSVLNDLTVSDYPTSEMVECFLRSKDMPLPFRMIFRDFMNKIGIQKAKIDSNKERLQLAVMHLAKILDSIVFFASLTYLTSNFGAKVIFSKWFETE